MRTWNLIVFVLLTSGCSIVRSLMPPPLVYLASNFEAFDELDPALAGNTIKVMYVTDRASFIDKATGDLVYTYGRSPSFALGTAEVILGPDLTWRELAEVANAGARRHNIPLRLGAVEEFVRTPPTPYPYEFVNGQFRLPAELQARIDADFERGGVRLREALGRSQRKKPSFMCMVLATNLKMPSLLALSSGIIWAGKVFPSSIAGPLVVAV